MIDFGWIDYTTAYDEPAGACEACNGFGEREQTECRACHGTGLDGDGYVGNGAEPLRVPFLEAVRVR